MTDGRTLKDLKKSELLFRTFSIKVNIICLLSYPDHGKAADELPKRIKQDMT